MYHTDRYIPTKKNFIYQLDEMGDLTLSKPEQSKSRFDRYVDDLDNVKDVKGDLIKLAKDDNFDYIVHGCNCYQTMGAGIAKAIKNGFPEADKADFEYGRIGDSTKAGEFSVAHINDKLTVINFYTQVSPGSDFNIKHLENCCKKFYEFLQDEPIITRKYFEVGFPWIGCGIGGGDKMEVLKVLADLNNGYGEEKICNVTIVEL